MSGEDVSKAPVNFGVSENRRVARPGEVARSAVPVGHFVTLAGLSFIHSLSTTRVTDGVAGFGARGFGARELLAEARKVGSQEGGSDAEGATHHQDCN